MIMELELSKNNFNIVRQIVINNIKSVNGIAMIDGNKFLVSDEISGIVTEHSF